MPRCVSVFYSSIWALWRNIRPQKTIHGVCLRDILKNIVTEDAYENSTSCNFMVQIFVYTKVHVKWGLTNMSNNHFTTKTIWTLSRCYFATSTKFFHNPNSVMHFYSNLPNSLLLYYNFILKMNLYSQVAFTKMRA